MSRTDDIVHHPADAADQMVDEALRAYPIPRPPADFRAAVMARVKTATPLARFQLDWLDYAISLFIMTAMAGLFIWLWRLLDLGLALQNQLDFTSQLPASSLAYWLIFFSGVIALLIAFLVVAAAFAWTRSPLTS